MTAAGGDLLTPPTPLEGKKSPAVSIVIPVLNAAEYLPALLEAIGSQSLPAEEVILVDSGSGDGTKKIAASRNEVRLLEMDGFTHGKSRNLGASEAKGEVVVFMTQDALPLDSRWLEGLLGPLDDPRNGAAYSRQVPREGATPMEQFFLLTRFPGEGRVQRKGRGAGELTLEDVFFSNVSSAARKAILERFPFDEALIMSEDQKFSKDLIEEGFSVVYAPESVVRHSHAYSLTDVFRRYFDSVHSLDEIFPSHTMGTSAAMGFSYLRKEFRHIASRHPKWLPYYFLYTLSKTMGTVAGHWAPWIPRPVLRRISLHGYHWDR